MHIHLYCLKKKLKQDENFWEVLPPSATFWKISKKDWALGKPSLLPHFDTNRFQKGTDFCYVR